MADEISFADYEEQYFDGQSETTFIPFTAADTVNLFARLEDLPGDIDLYLGRYDPALDGFLTLNSSTNPGQQNESIFAQLAAGDYVLSLRVNGGIELTDEQQQAEFKWSIDAKTFDENTILSNDPLLTKQWHLFNAGINAKELEGLRSSWIAAPNVDIAAPEAWKLSHDASTITIAIIDDGIDINHPDLKNNIWVNSGEIPNNQFDDDGNGKVDDINGWNFIDNSPRIIANADYDHGTHVAGIAGAVGNNQIGISGVAWDTQLMSLDISNGGDETALESDDQFWTAVVPEAIFYAVDNGADVINMSFGKRTKLNQEEFLAASINSPLWRAFQYAFDNDVFISIAAGNEGAEFNNRNQWMGISDLDTYLDKPASYSEFFGNVASVGSSNADNLLSSFSNSGQSISISAPGGDGSKVIIDYTDDQVIYADVPNAQILSTVPTGTGSVEQDYGYMAGTSMSAPVIAGMAALIRAQNPSITAQDTLAILRAGSNRNPRLVPYVNQGYEAKLDTSLEIAQAWQGPATLTAIDQDIAPVINLSAITTAQTLSGILNIIRNTEDDAIIGFYKVLDVYGTVLDSMGNPVMPGDINYQQEALNTTNLVNSINDLQGDGGIVQSTPFAIPGERNSMYLAPYAITNEQSLFPWSAANNSGLDHFKALDSNLFGLRTTANGPETDSFDDVVMHFASQHIH